MMFDDFLSDLTPYRDKLDTLYGINNKSHKLYLHFPSFYSVWATLSTSNIMKQQNILNDAKQQKYYLDNEVLAKVCGKPLKCLVLSVKKQDMSKELLTFVTPSAVNPSQNICKCPSDVIFQRGCQCGGA